MEILTLLCGFLLCIISYSAAPYWETFGFPVCISHKGPCVWVVSYLWRFVLKVFVIVFLFNWSLSWGEAHDSVFSVQLYSLLSTIKFLLDTGIRLISVYPLIFLPLCFDPKYTGSSLLSHIIHSWKFVQELHVGKPDNRLIWYKGGGGSIPRELKRW